MFKQDIKTIKAGKDIIVVSENVNGRPLVGAGSFAVKVRHVDFIESWANDGALTLTAKVWFEQPSADTLDFFGGVFHVASHTAGAFKGKLMLKRKAGSFHKAVNFSLA